MRADGVAGRAMNRNPFKIGDRLIGSALRFLSLWEFGPKAVLKFPDTFSNSMFAMDIALTLQPALVHGTHGAGAFFPSGVTMKKLGSVAVFTMSVQY
jgi:hypothetical protein